MNLITRSLFLRFSKKDLEKEEEKEEEEEEEKFA